MVEFLGIKRGISMGVAFVFVAAAAVVLVVYEYGAAIRDETKEGNRRANAALGSRNLRGVLLEQKHFDEVYRLKIRLSSAPDFPLAASYSDLFSIEYPDILIIRQKKGGFSKNDLLCKREMEFEFDRC